MKGYVRYLIGDKDFFKVEELICDCPNLLGNILILKEKLLQLMSTFTKEKKIITNYYVIKDILWFHDTI